MDQLRILLKKIKDERITSGNLLGLLHVLVGRTIRLADGSPVSFGMTWRDLAVTLKKIRWDPELVKELGIDPDSLPPRDRERFWYMVIGQAQIQTPQAIAQGNRLQEILRPYGYLIGSPPGETKS